MAKKLTETELAEALEKADAGGPTPYERMARAAAEALGQELAPPGPELAEWFGEEVARREGSDNGYLVVRESGALVALGSVPHYIKAEQREGIDRNRGTLAEGYNRFCRLLAKLVKPVPQGCGVYEELADDLLRIAEGKEG